MLRTASLLLPLFLSPQMRLPPLPVAICSISFLSGIFVRYLSKASWKSRCSELPGSLQNNLGHASKTSGEWQCLFFSPLFVCLFVFTLSSCFLLWVSFIFRWRRDAKFHRREKVHSRGRWDTEYDYAGILCNLNCRKVISSPALECLMLMGATLSQWLWKSW